MKVIYKYKLKLDSDVNDIFLPEEARVLDVQMQEGELVLWAFVDTDKKVVRRQFLIFGTGHEITVKNLAYIVTFQMGLFVFHVFEKIGK